MRVFTNLSWGCMALLVMIASLSLVLTGCSGKEEKIAPREQIHKSAPGTEQTIKSEKSNEPTNNRPISNNPKNQVGL